MLVQTIRMCHAVFIIYIRFFLKSRKSETFPKLSHEFADAVIAFI